MASGQWSVAPQWRGGTGQKSLATGHWSLANGPWPLAIVPPINGTLSTRPEAPVVSNATALDDSAHLCHSRLAADAAALVRVLRRIVDHVSNTEPHRLEAALRSMASAVDRMSPELLLGFAHADDPELVAAVISRVSDDTIARF